MLLKSRGNLGALLRVVLTILHLLPVACLAGSQGGDKERGIWALSPKRQTLNPKPQNPKA